MLHGCARAMAGDTGCARAFVSIFTDAVKSKLTNTNYTTSFPANMALLHLERSQTSSIFTFVANVCASGGRYE